MWNVECGMSNRAVQNRDLKDLRDLKDPKDPKSTKALKSTAR